MRACAGTDQGALPAFSFRPPGAARTSPRSPANRRDNRRRRCTASHEPTARPTTGPTE
jgi:hypothetical protein